MVTSWLLTQQKRSWGEAETCQTCWSAADLSSGAAKRYKQLWLANHVKSELWDVQYAAMLSVDNHSLHGCWLSVTFIFVSTQNIYGFSMLAADIFHVSYLSYFYFCHLILEYYNNLFLFPWLVLLVHPKSWICLRFLCVWRQFFTFHRCWWWCLLLEECLPCVLIHRAKIFSINWMPSNALPSTFITRHCDLSSTRRHRVLGLWPNGFISFIKPWLVKSPLISTVVSITYVPAATFGHFWLQLIPVFCS